MIQGSSITRSNKGMRKGISLVEMLVAIVLFGIIGTISYTYYKNYYDTSFAAKQLRIYTIVDQAAQLGNAFDLYNTKNGVDPTTVDQLVEDKILTQVPVAQPFVTATGWTLDENVTIDGNDTTGVAFMYLVDGVGSNTDKLDYCNILNNTANKDSNLSRTDADQNETSDLYAAGVASATSEQEYFHCADVNASGDPYKYRLTFVKRATVE
jgi:prepilin-type N-terminal cleavage/methylation domain-containing protein